MSTFSHCVCSAGVLKALKDDLLPRGNSSEEILKARVSLRKKLNSGETKDLIIILLDLASPTVLDF